MKTRIITAAVGLGVLAVVLAFFDTFLFDLVLSAVCLIAIHEVFSAMGFGKKQWYLYAAAVPLTLLVMLSTLQMVRGLLLPAAFLTVLFYNVCQIAHVKTLDFGKLTGFVYFSGVITFCFYSLIHLKRMLPFAEYRYDAIYFILLILCFAWGGDTAAYFAGRAFGRHKLAPIVSPHKTVEGAVGGVLGSMAAGCVLTLVYSLLSAKYNVISIQGVLPKEYEGKDIPEHWRVMLTPVTPPEKGYPHFRNVYVSKIKAENVDEFISASGWNDSLRLENFYLYAIEAQTNKPGKICYTRNFNLSEITLDVKDKDAIVLKENEQSNIHFDYVKTTTDRRTAGNLPH